MIRSYHIDLGQRDVRLRMYDDFVFDDDGVPRYPYGGQLYYNPTFVAHYALYHLGLFQRTNELAHRDRFLNVARALLKSGRATDVGLVFEYEMSMPGLSTPWISALGQGRAASTFARAYEATDDEAFLSAAVEALKPFNKPVGDGGVLTHFADGGPAFEEYPRSQPDVVLNGLVTALFGLYDAAVSCASNAQLDASWIEELFSDAVAALQRNLVAYDLGYWSAYDLSGRVASDEYHDYHVTLLWALFEITHVDTFADYARRWGGLPRGPRLLFGRNVSRVKSRLFNRALYRS